MKKKMPGRKIIINSERLETRVALLHDGRLEEYQIERADEKSIVGSIYLGRIVNLEPSLQAAFVDIGLEKNAFLHYWDMIPASYDKVESLKPPEDGKDVKKKKLAGCLKKLFSAGKKPNIMQQLREKTRSADISTKDIPDLFPVGSKIIVQVTKGPIGTKGPRVSTNLSIPGRYLVFLPNSDHIGLSKKIDDRKERSRLRKIISELEMPEGMGLICRTVGEGRKAAFFQRDLEMLLDRWQVAEEKLANPKAPSLLYSEPNLLERTVRDFLTEDIDEIIVDTESAYDYLRGTLERFFPNEGAKMVSAYAKAKPVLEYFGIEKQVADIFNRQVRLPGGGYICVDETEALIAIDINTGGGHTGKNQDETILATNLEAADEIARQLRLRNIGGLVVIDFIDMRPAKDRETVLRRMRKLVRDDRAKTKVMPISRLGLMEMTRQREYESLSDQVYDPCPYCQGRGRVKSFLTMSVEIQRRLHEILQRNRHEKDFSLRVIVHPSVLARLKNRDSNLLIETEERYGSQLSFRGDPTMHLEKFRLVDPETGADY